MPIILAEDLEPLVTLDEVLVTPTGSERAAFDTSLPVNSIDWDDLEEKVAFSVSEIFEREPGIDVVTTGSGSVHPVIRGLGGERVLVLVDGIRMSEQRPGGNHVFSLDPAQIERVEVVRGPASVLYGSDAIGGVVNFVSKGANMETGPDLRYGGEFAVEFEGATEGLKESTHLRFGKGRFNGYFGGTYRDTGNIDTAEGELPNSFYDGFTVWTGGNYIGEGWETYADYSLMVADIGIPGPAAFSEDYFKNEKHQRLALGFRADELSGLAEHFSVDLGWQRHNRHRYRLKTAGIPAALEGDLEVNIALDIDTYTLKPQMVFDSTEAHRVTLGLDSFYEDASSGRTLRDTDSNWVNPRFDEVPVIPNSSRTGVGAFLQDEITLGERMVVTAGTRFDWIKAETDGHFRHQLTTSLSSESSTVSGNAGLLYRLSEEVNLFANLGRAFRAPTLLELYFFGPHDVGNDIGNPDLHAETSWNVDFGVKAQSDRLRSSISVFFNTIDDYIVKENQGNGNYLYLNYDDVTLYGAEADMDYEIGNGFSVFACVAFTRGEIDGSQADLPGVPPLKLNYGLRYDGVFGEDGNVFWAELSGVSASRQDRVGTNERVTDGYSIFDLRAGMDLNETWSVVAALENVTDEAYKNHLSAAWQEFGLSDRVGRSLKLSFKSTF